MCWNWERVNDTRIRIEYVRYVEPEHDSGQRCRCDGRRPVRNVCRGCLFKMWKAMRLSAASMPTHTNTSIVLLNTHTHIQTHTSDCFFCLHKCQSNTTNVLFSLTSVLWEHRDDAHETATNFETDKRVRCVCTAKHDEVDWRQPQLRKCVGRIHAFNTRANAKLRCCYAFRGERKLASVDESIYRRCDRVWWNERCVREWIFGWTRRVGGWVV